MMSIFQRQDSGGVNEVSHDRKKSEDLSVLSNAFDPGRFFRPGPATVSAHDPDHVKSTYDRNCPETCIISRRVFTV